MPHVPKGHQARSTHDRQATVQVLNHAQLHASGQLYAYVEHLSLEILNDVKWLQRFPELFVGLEGEG